MLLSGCEKKTESVYMDDPWPYGVTYEIFVQSFADSNGDGIGDIPGMTAKLDYLADLGVQGVWLMPISPSPSYHKYDVTDYRGIHPDYGTMDDFKRFVSEAHKRNIRVIIDLVVNHTSSEHPWFKSAAADKYSRYRDYYIWANFDSIQNEISKKEVTLDSDNITQWHPSEGNEKYYYGFFWGGMPDLNFDNQEVRKEITDIGRFWLEEIGVDGFRLDAARHIYPDDQAEASHDWWIEFGEAMRSINPDVYMVGEVWGDYSETAPYLKGLPSMFNFDFWRGIEKTLQEEQNQGVIDDLIEAQTYFAEVNPDYVDAIFVNNHDQNRLLSNIGGDPQKAKLAMSILLTLKGMPYLYYGDEIGMLGKKPDPEIREPFLWDSSTSAKEQTTWIAGKNSNDSTVVPLSIQKDDPNSIYTHVKKLIKTRTSEPALQYGKMTPLTLPEDLMGYSRKTANEQIVVIHNLSGDEVDIDMSDYDGWEMLFVTGGTVHSQGSLPAYGSIILKESTR